jgi:hypothetical protein
MRIRRGGRGCRSSPRSGSAGGAAVDVGPDQLGVAARAIVLAGRLLNSFVRNSEKVGVNVCSPEIPTKMPTNRTAAVNFYACFQCATKIFLKNMESNQ